MNSLLQKGDKSFLFKQFYKWHREKYKQYYVNYKQDVNFLISMKKITFLMFVIITFYYLG